MHQQKGFESHENVQKVTSKTSFYGEKLRWRFQKSFTRRSLGIVQKTQKIMTSRSNSKINIKFELNNLQQTAFCCWGRLKSVTNVTLGLCINRE